jgi:hypothetical protein
LVCGAVRGYTLHGKIQCVDSNLGDKQTIMRTAREI